MTQETFERELTRRADDVHGAPFSLDDVRGKAMSIRRRRRAAVAGGVAAVVALVVLVPTVLGGGSGPKSDGVDPAPPAPGHSAVLHDGTLTLPDGSEVRLGVDNEDVTQLGVLTDGRIVLALQQPFAVRVYQPDGTLQEQYAVQTNAITMSANDDAVAWIGEDFRSWVLASGAAEPVQLNGVPMPGEASGSIDAVLSPDHLLVGDWNTTTGEVIGNSYRQLTSSEPFRVTDVSPDGDLWAVVLPPGPDEQFGCAALYDPEGAEIVAETCDTWGLRFSPDGQHLLGSRGDNAMISDATVLDLDLAPVGQWESSGRGDVLKSVVWSDAGHLLVSETNWKDSSWALVRVDLTWADREVLDGPVSGGNPETTNEYLLSE